MQHGNLPMFLEKATSHQVLTTPDHISGITALGTELFVLHHETPPDAYMLELQQEICYPLWGLPHPKF